MKDKLIHLLKKIALKRGYIVSQAQRLGLDLFQDISRLSAAWAIPIRTVFDVGANSGQTALELLAHLPAAHIFSFEPHPTTFAKLLATIGNVPNFTATNTALGATTGSLPMTVYDLDCVNTLRPGFHPTGRFQATNSIEVPVTTLDLFCATHAIPAIDLLKIDTEGFDLMVLHGAANLLANGKVTFVYVEFNDLDITGDDSGSSLLAIDAYLRPFGYRFIATYNDYNNLEGRLFQSSNALFALPPAGR
jgi:FkbM family methyltransferase